MFRILALCLSLALLEGLSALVWWLELPGARLNGTRSRRQDVIRSSRPLSHPTEAIHPYLGWVLNPDLHAPQDAGARQIAINRFGFVDDGDTVYKRTPDRLLVGIVGGSVAQNVSVQSDSTLRRILESSPEMQERKVQFVRLALAGHKQPQQLMNLSYLLALGGELDVLINIDGYNEVALTITENASSGVALSYPRAWHHRLQDVVDPRVDSESFQLLRLRVARRQTAGLMSAMPLGSSPTANLVWLVYDRWMESRFVALSDVLQKHSKQAGHGFAKDGPADRLQSDEENARAVCDLWTDASRQLHRLCVGNRIAYVHILQPNQYLAGSKPLSALEKQKFYVAHEQFAEAIRTIYPRLRLASETLRAEGVACYDGTQLFAAVEETIYADYFCHYNQKGNDLLAEMAAKLVVENLRANFRTGSQSPGRESVSRETVMPCAATGRMLLKASLPSSLLRP